MPITKDDGDATSRTFTIPLPPSFDPDRDDAGRLHEWLTKRGVNVESVSVGKGGVLVTSDTDPSAVLTQYTPPQPLLTRGQRDALRTQLKAFDFDRDPAAVVEAVTIMRDLVLDLTT